MKLNPEELKKRLPDRVSRRRAEHILGVAREIEYMADSFGLGEEDRLGLICAALLHDVTKEETIADQVKRIRDFGLPLSEDDLRAEETLHALSGYVCARTDFQLPETYAAAVRAHSTGWGSMRLLDKLLFAADYIEEGRPYENCKKIRNFFHEGVDRGRNLEERLEILDRSVYNIANNTVEYLIRRNMFIHPNTLILRNSLLHSMKGSAK